MWQKPRSQQVLLHEQRMFFAKTSGTQTQRRCVSKRKKKLKKKNLQELVALEVTPNKVLVGKTARSGKSITTDFIRFL